MFAYLRDLAPLTCDDVVILLLMIRCCEFVVDFVVVVGVVIVVVVAVVVDDSVVDSMLLLIKLRMTFVAWGFFGLFGVVSTCRGKDNVDRRQSLHASLAFEQ